MSEPQVSGHVESGWDGVRDAFIENLASGDDIGASVAVYHRGRLMVDLVGGSFDGGDRPYDADTLQLVFSTTKGITATAVAMCVERGLLSYDEKVATYWPEFAAHGKGEATVAQLLSHQCGLFSVDGPITLDEALDWNTVTARLADTSPDWPVGSGHGYHAVTYGWLAGELVKRVTGHGFGRFVADEIAAPLGIDLFIGLPAELEPRVSPLIGAPLSIDAIEDPAIKAMMEMFLGPETRGGRALSLNGAFSGDDTFNSRAVRAAEIPAANGVTNARSLATMYAATIGEIDGVRLLQSDTVDRARRTVTPDGEADLCLMMPTTFGMGYMTHGAFTPYSGAGAFGHPGAGGSVAFAHPERDLAFGYAMNKMASNLAGDLRAQKMIEAAVVACG